MDPTAAPAQPAAPLDSSPAQSGPADVAAWKADLQRRENATALIIEALIAAESAGHTGSNALHYALGYVSGPTARFRELNDVLARLK